MLPSFGVFDTFFGYRTALFGVFDTFFGFRTASFANILYIGVEFCTENQKFSNFYTYILYIGVEKITKILVFALHTRE